jgi:natural product precursor
MKKQMEKLNLSKEISRNEMKQVKGGAIGYRYTYCTGGGPYQIGCQPGYCYGASHGSFSYCS